MIDPCPIPPSRGRRYRLQPPAAPVRYLPSDNDAPRLARDGSGVKYEIRDFPRTSAPDRAGLRQTGSLRVGVRGASPRPRREAIHLRFQDGASWLTPSGVAKKRKMLEGKGLPDFKGRRFVTLTLDRAQFGDCPLTGYLAGKEKMRRFLDAGREAGLWKKDAYWAWKLEFQKDGWAHWHIIIDRTAKFSLEQMRTIDRIWGLGRTNCRRISKSAFGYQFKYAFKGVFQDDGEDSGLCVPQWFLEYYKPGGTDRPKSFQRVRFWQTSKGFYTGVKPVEREKTTPQSSYLPRPVAEDLDDRVHSVLVIARNSAGKYQLSSRLRLGVSIKHFIRVHLWDAENGYGCTLSSRSYAMDPQTVSKLIHQTEKWKLQQLHQANKLTLRKAQAFRRQHKSLETC